jgi:nicotinate-nucleotide adenylyltransferase
MKVGLFFGSFNPIHTGHLVIAEYLAENADLDQVWLVVSPHNPLKNKSALLANNHRLAMVKLAVDDSKKIKVSDIEFKLPVPSYTINTILHLKEKYPKHTFTLLLGADNLETFTKWKNYEQLIELCELYVYPRPGYTGGNLKDHARVKWVNAPLMEISATYIRNAIKEGKSARFMLPDAVYKYISEMNFYKK